jgi:hypothetical protein
MFTLIFVMYVQYANTSIHIEQAQMQERYKDLSACTQAGASIKPTSATPNPIVDLRVGFFCVEAGTEKPKT